MLEKKSYTQWEKELGVINIKASAEVLQSKLTKEQFIEAWGDEVPQGVNHKDRVKFLEDNGYEVNRQNMADASLSAKPQPKE